MDDDAEGVWFVRKCRSMSVFPITTQERHDVLRLAYTFCPHSDPIRNTMLAQCSDQPDLATITYTSDGRARKVRDATKVAATAETSKTVHSDRFTKNEVQRASGSPESMPNMMPMNSQSQASSPDFRKDVIRHGENFAPVAAKAQPKKVTIFGKRLLVQGKVAINELWRDPVGRMNDGELPKPADLENFRMFKWTLAMDDQKIFDELAQRQCSRGGIRLS